MALPIIITTAGLAALVNASSTGTASVTIAQVGISATAQATTAATTVVTGEIKRLATIAGQVVSPDIFHIAIADQTADTYQLRTFGLYLDTGVLFGIYSQAGVIAEKASAASLLLDADIKLTSPLAGAISFGNVSFANPPASETVIGVLRLATNAEAIAGISSNRGLVPSSLKAALDDRFGAGSPAAFFKTLMTSASAGALRLLLAIKGAALKDEGAGNGLDADLLDGQHGAFYQAWGNLTGKPATFSPSAHTHAAADTTSGIFDVLRIPDLVMAKITDLAGALAGKSDSGHTHDASGTVSGIFNVLRIPDLLIAKITGLQGVLDTKAPLNNPVFTGQGGAEGGQINLLRPTASTSLSGDVAIDLLGNNLRFFDSSGSLRGCTIDLTACAAGIQTQLYHTANLNLAVYQVSGAAITLPSNGGVGGFSIGPSDGASYTAHNMILKGWWGLGMVDYVNQVNGVYDFRVGRWDTKAAPRVNGTDVWYPGNFDPALKASLNATVRFASVLVGAGNGFVYSDGSSSNVAVRVGTPGNERYFNFGEDGNFYALNGFVFSNGFPVWTSGNDDRVSQLGLYRRATAPAGYLKADGSAVSRTTYAALFAVIGTSEGAGDGATTFNIPDWRGVFFRGLDEARGADPGRTLGSYQADQNQIHNHGLPSRSNPNAGSGYVEDADSSGTVQTTYSDYSGGSEARPKNIALLACIKY